MGDVSAPTPTGIKELSSNPAASNAGILPLSPAPADDSTEFTILSSSTPLALRATIFPASPAPALESTDRLALIEARGLAQRSVWRAYRVMDEDVEFAHANAKTRRLGKSAPIKPIVVPGYGKLRNRRQLTISAFAVEQVDRKSVV